jgi:glucans biosynthesis protein
MSFDCLDAEWHEREVKERMSFLNRRAFVRSAAALAGSLPFSRDLLAADDEGLDFGKPESFSFDALIDRARLMAARPYVPPYRPAPEILDKIDYDVHGKIRFKPDRALFGKGPSQYPVMFFHLGQWFKSSVKMHVVQAGKSREILYSPDDFDMPADSIARKLPRDSGFAGFRFHEARRRPDWKTQDWLAFLGASYFRAIGDEGQYGISARGVAVNTSAAGTTEEFPEFTEFFIEGAPSENQPTIVYALLSGPSLSGAYRFTCHRTKGVVMEVDAALFVRNPIAQLGLAPLTSMFWFAEYDSGFRVDWRPEIHDSDGLALWTGTGERIWRPLHNPLRTVTSTFVDRTPKGFGLLQRDRTFDHYLDGVMYDRRPSLWIEPLGDWGAGAVKLVEIPTDDEIHDNVVAFWQPAEPAKAGAAIRIGYRLHWQAEEPFPATNVAHVFSTRIGRGGKPGTVRPKGVTKFVVEFAGKALENLPRDTKPSANITASRGEISYVFVEPTPGTKRWRAQFDLAAPGTDISELRLFLRQGDRTLSETWLCQYDPRPA